MNKDRDAKDIVGEQHAFLDHAKDFNWTEVMRILDINPHFVNVTPGGTVERPAPSSSFSEQPGIQSVEGTWGR